MPTAGTSQIRIVRGGSFSSAFVPHFNWINAANSDCSRQPIKPGCIRGWSWYQFIPENKKPRASENDGRDDYCLGVFSPIPPICSRSRDAARPKIRTGVGYGTGAYTKPPV